MANVKLSASDALIANAENKTKGIPPMMKYALWGLAIVGGYFLVKKFV